MISKVIVHAKDRSRAIAKLNEALEDYKVIGLPTNIKFVRRLLALDEFNSGKFDTGLIVKHEDNLLKSKRKLSLFRQATIAVAKVFLETLKYRIQRDHELNPWEQRDNFRLNHISKRQITLQDGDGTERDLYVEYLKENTFNCYQIDENGFFDALLLDAEIEMHPEQKDALVVRTQSETFRVDYYLSENDTVTQLDYEGAPLNIYVKPKKLITAEDVEDRGSASPRSALILSPMPGRIVKAFVQPGDTVKKG